MDEKGSIIDTSEQPENWGVYANNIQVASSAYPTSTIALVGEEEEGEEEEEEEVAMAITNVEATMDTSITTP